MPSLLDTIVASIAHVPSRGPTVIGVPQTGGGPSTLLLALLAALATVALMAGLAAM